MNPSKPPTTPGPATLDQYQRDDGSWIVHLDTHSIPDNAQGPLLTVYLNDDMDEPIWDNQEHTA